MLTHITAVKRWVSLLYCLAARFPFVCSNLGASSPKEAILLIEADFWPARDCTIPDYFDVCAKADRYQFHLPCPCLRPGEFAATTSDTEVETYDDERAANLSRLLGNLSASKLHKTGP